MKRLFLLAVLAAVLLAGCHTNSRTGYERRYLNSQYGCVNNEWLVCLQGEILNNAHPATVPGNIHDDLLANKLIPDPFYGDNESKVQWVSDSVWEYIVHFDKDCGHGKSFAHNELVFEGLDTYAEVYINGQRLVATTGDSLTNNMFRTWRFPMPEKLDEVGNELRVRFLPSAPFDSIEASKLPYKLPDNRVFTRKAQYESGWDWGPKLNTCGIWKDVYIESWNDMKINDFYVKDTEPSHDPSRPWISDVEVEIQADKKLTANLLLSITDKDGYNQEIQYKAKLHKGDNKVIIPVTIENPKLWWPNGAGEAHLYYFNLSTEGMSTPMLHAHGLRTVELVQKKDSIGESFQFIVNGKPLFMRGTDWIPASSYPGVLARSEGDDRYAELLKQAKDANMNMIRVWGGGLYEHEAFYNYCDQLGLLVWQDFMFACNIYPGDQAFMENVKIEAEEQVRRLRHHACIATWCGNNEVHNGLEDWGWQDALGYTDQQYAQMYEHYEQLFEKLLPKVCLDNSYKSNYVHSSPTYGWGHPECTTHGCSHYWGVWWGELPFEIWWEKTGRFMTEYGFQAYPEMSLWNDYIPEGERKLQSPAMRNHQKHGRGVPIILKAMEDLYGFKDTNNLDKFVYISQLVQSDGIAQAIEAHRIQHEKCSGTLFWQLNDCWPVASWSCIDVAGNPKALYYRLPQLYANVAIASRHISQDTIELYLINDSFETTSGQFEWAIKTMDGILINTAGELTAASANSSIKTATIALPKGVKNVGNFFVEASFTPNNAKQVSYLTYFVKPKLLNLTSDPITVKTEYGDHCAEIHLSAKSLKKGVFIEETHGYPIVYSDNYFDLKPGEEVVIKVEYPLLDGKPEFRIKSWQ
ncbi:MAG: glycoside hydrolase family 2 protein [Bacteroidales bacterium]|nr:glycoside hydrolase family 2 protein [Bacteroidales bacterium]